MIHHEKQHTWSHRCQQETSARATSFGSMGSRIRGLHGALDRVDEKAGKVRREMPDVMRLFETAAKGGKGRQSLGETNFYDASKMFEVYVTVLLVQRPAMGLIQKTAVSHVSCRHQSIQNQSHGMSTELQKFSSEVRFYVLVILCRLAVWSWLEPAEEQFVLVVTCRWFVRTFCLSRWNIS